MRALLSRFFAMVVSSLIRRLFSANLPQISAHDRFRCGVAKGSTVTGCPKQAKLRSFLDRGDRNHDSPSFTENSRLFADFHRGDGTGFRLAAFTLLELLLVISIIVVLTLIAIPALSSLKGGSDLTGAAYSIAGILDQARAYAIANNTYVWVGITEVDVSRASTTTPQVAGNGRVAIAVTASRNGTRGYDASSSSLVSPCWSNYNNGANLVALNKLQYFENVHLSTNFSAIPVTGNLARPSPVYGGTDYTLGNTNLSSVTPFDWPLGAAIGSGQYSFTKVINFDPMGVPRIQLSSNQDGIVAYMEIGLIPTHGNAVPGTTPANIAAIQIDGMTGTTRIYRP